MHLQDPGRQGRHGAIGKGRADTDRDHEEQGQQVEGDARADDLLDVGADDGTVHARVRIQG